MGRQIYKYKKGQEVITNFLENSNLESGSMLGTENDNRDYTWINSHTRKAMQGKKGIIVNRKGALYRVEYITNYGTKKRDWLAAEVIFLLDDPIVNDLIKKQEQFEFWNEVALYDTKQKINRTVN